MTPQNLQIISNVLTANGQPLPGYVDSTTYEILSEAEQYGYPYPSILTISASTAKPNDVYYLRPTVEPHHVFRKNNGETGVETNIGMWCN